MNNKTALERICELVHHLNPNDIKALENSLSLFRYKLEQSITKDINKLIDTTRP